MKVLIAEDDLVTRTLMMRATKHAGHEGVSASDGGEMLALYERFRPDIALVDWRMPVLDGVEAIREMRRMPGGKDVFVVVVTAVDGEAETARALEAGIDDYLLKPISAPRLRLILKLAEVRLSRRRSREEREGIEPADAIEHFGFVAAADADGRLLFMHNAPAMPEVDLRPGDALDSLFDRDRFSNALMQTDRTGDPVRFSVTHGPMAGANLVVQAIRKSGDLSGYLIGEATRMLPKCASGRAPALQRQAGGSK